MENSRRVSQSENWDIADGWLFPDELPVSDLLRIFVRLKSRNNFFKFPSYMSICYFLRYELLLVIYSPVFFHVYIAMETVVLKES